MEAILAKAFNVAILIGIPCTYIAVPVMSVWDWVRWNKEKKPRNSIAVFSYASFGLATGSLMLAVCSISYSLATGGFAYYAPSLMRIFYWGFRISAIALILAFVAMWRRNPLRWNAAACSLGMLFFWSYSAMLE